MDNAIQVDHVSKKFRLYYDRPLTLKERMVRGAKGAYREFYALKDVSFEIKKGSTVGLIGRNGSGKSTMLKLINRTMFPDEGKITIKGKVASLIELGAGFHPELSGRENIYTNASVFGFTREEIERRLPEIIRFSELEEFIDNPVRTYSSGMYARLAFSVAINVDPEILLVDEILGVGDLNFQKKCADRIYEMRKSGTTIIVVTHDMNTVDRLCDYGIWLDGGVKIDEGQPRYIQNRYIEFMAGEQEKQIQKENVGPVASAVLASEEMRDDDATMDSHCADGRERIAIEDITEMGHHFGTGDVIFTSVKVLDERGVDKRSFQSDEPVRLVVGYKCQVPPESLSVNIGLEIRTADGIHISGTNTARDGFRGLKLRATGAFEILFPELNLVDGLYYFGTAISNREETVDYDFYHEIVTLRIYSRERGTGLVSMKHSYILDNQLLTSSFGCISSQKA